MTSSSGSKPEDKITPQPLMLPRESGLKSVGIGRNANLEAAAWLGLWSNTPSTGPGRVPQGTRHDHEDGAAV
jgi:hypothetical protein